MSKYSGTYVREEETYTIHIDYSYYWDNGDYYQPPEDDLTIKAVWLNGQDITDFFWDYVIDSVHEDVKEYAVENKPWY